MNKGFVSLTNIMLKGCLLYSFKVREGRRTRDLGLWY